VREKYPLSEELSIVRNSARPPHGHFKTWERLKILPFLDDNALESIGNPLTRPG
jgi:hypothetical protein